jgi:hypothetical protein
VTFLADDKRTPFAIGPSRRNNVPTESPQQSLINDSRQGAPLVMTFDPPQRVATLHFGQADLSGFAVPGVHARAVLQAFDQNDLPMGQIVRAIPPAVNGITHFIGAAAIFPDQLIHRLELRYEAGVDLGSMVVWMPHPEPVQIDGLIVCDRIDTSQVRPSFTPPPEFGDMQVRLRVDSEVIVRVPAGPGSEPGYLTTIHNPFSGLPVEVDGSPSITALMLTRPEGTTVKLSAPANFGGGRFLYWRHSSGVSLGKGAMDVPLTLLRDGVMTAVYRGREQRNIPSR